MWDFGSHFAHIVNRSNKESKYDTFSSMYCSVWKAEGTIIQGKKTESFPIYSAPDWLALLVSFLMLYCVTVTQTLQQSLSWAVLSLNNTPTSSLILRSHFSLQESPYALKVEQAGSVTHPA